MRWILAGKIGLANPKRGACCQSVRRGQIGMRISAAEAYSMLEEFQARLTRLHLSGRIGDEEAFCDHAIIAAVDPGREFIEVDLHDHNGPRSWNRRIRLHDATFHVEEWSGNPFEQVLVLRYPDETVLRFSAGPAK